MSDYDAMIRWQGYARESRSAANSHFLAYSAAILALQTSILVDKDVNQIAWPYIYTMAGFFAILALLLGSLVLLVRLRDARLTARVARYRYAKKSQEEIDAIRNKADFYSGWVNKLLPLQVISFAISALLLVIWVGGANMGKLFSVSG
jgi:hypothetical protein